MTHKIIRDDGVTELTPIKAVTRQQSVNTDVDLRPGCVSSMRIEVEVFGSASDAPASGEALTVYEVDEEGNETLLGTFYAQPAVSSKTTYMFTAYDGMKKTEADFSQRLREIQDSFPVTLGNLVIEALSVAGLTLSGSFPMINMPVQQFLQDGLTCRDILSYAAEIACRFVRCDPDGSAVFDWYEDAEYTPDPTLTPRIYPSGGQSGTEMHIAYKQDGMEYEAHDTDAIVACAVHPSDNEAEPVVYPSEGMTTITADVINVSDSRAEDIDDMVITIPYSPTAHGGVEIHVTGKNIFNPKYSGTSFGLTYTLNADKTYTVNGMGLGGGVSTFLLGDMPIPYGISTLFFSGNMSGSNPVGDTANWWTECDATPNRAVLSVNLTGNSTSVITLPDRSEYSALRVFSNVIDQYQIDNKAYAPMFTLNALDGSEYEPYGTTYSVLFGSAVTGLYGGTYNPITGEIVSMYDASGNLLATPVTYHIDPIEIQARDGRLLIWANGHQVTDNAYKPYYPIYASYPSSSGFNGNTMHVRNNLLLAGASFDTLTSVARNIYTEMVDVAQYRPASINLFPFENPFKVGDVVNVTDSQSVSFQTLVMSMTVSPTAAVISSTGNEEYDADYSDSAKVLQNLTDNIIRVNKLKVSWADIDEAVIRSLQTNYLKILGLLVSGEFTGPDSLVTQLVDSIIQFFRGDDSQMFGAIGLNQVDSTDNALHVSSTDDGDKVAVDYFTGTEYKPAYEADFTDPDNPVNEFTGTMTLNGQPIQAGGSALTLLWTNSSPYVAFSAQTILSSGVLADYDMFAIKFKEQSTSSGSSEFIFWYTKTSGSNVTTARWVSRTGSNIFFNTRSFSLTDNGIAFNGGERNIQGSSSATANNAYMVPWAVYGLKL